MFGIRIIGGGLFPVLSELTAQAENEKTLAAQLGVILSPHHWIHAWSEKEGSHRSGEGDLGISIPCRRDWLCHPSPAYVSGAGDCGGVELG
ncbi:hypothetical protein BH18VER2_BH18VER2_08520 [soil metagenome]